MAKGASAVWETRPGLGSDTNGGAYDSTIAGAGTNFSQQNAAQIAVTDAVTNNTTTVTSATASFASSHIGNAIYLSGTGTTTDRYFVTAVTNATTITVDRATGSTGGTGVTLNLGGALASLTEAYGTRGGVGSNIFWTKNTGTIQSITATLTPPAGVSGSPTITAGYNSTRGDLDSVNDFSNFPTVQVNNAAIAAFTLSTTYQRLRNFIIDGAGGVTKGTIGVTATSNHIVVENCKASNFTTNGFTSGGIALFRRCWVTSMASGATSAFNLTSSAVRFVNCVASANPCPGFRSASAAGWFQRCLAYANTGASSDGFQSTGTTGAMCISCVAYNNGRDGIRWDGANSADDGAAYNCLLVGNAGYGLNSATTAWADLPVDYNAFFNNTTAARNGVPTGAHDVTLSGDPFTNAASGNFSLNNTAGAGAACRAAGFPGVFPAGLTTSYLDIGGVQHQDTGGTAGMLYVPNLEGT